MDSITLSPASPVKSSNIGCYADISDSENTTLTVEYWWYNSSDLVFGGNATHISTSGSQLISTLSSTYTDNFETWNCTARGYDGWDYSGYDSAAE